MEERRESADSTGTCAGEHGKSINFWNEQVDEQGNLVGPEQYIWITFNVKNLSEKEAEILLNNPIVVIDSDNIVTETVAEARFINPEQEGMSPQKRFHCILQSGEEKEIEVGYIVEEKNATDSLYYCIGVGGSQLDNPNNIFLYLGELMNEE